MRVLLDAHPGGGGEEAILFCVCFDVLLKNNAEINTGQSSVQCPRQISMPVYLYVMLDESSVPKLSE